MPSLISNSKFVTILSLSLLLTACQTFKNNNNDVDNTLDDTNTELELIKEKHITSKHLLTDIAALSADQFGGRAPFSEGEKLTLDYIEQNFIANGLAPMFGDSYRQAVPMVAITANPETVRIVVEHNKIRSDLKYGSEIMIGSSQTVDRIDVLSSQIVFAGYGIVAPEYGWDDYKDLDVKGKTVMVLINDPGFVLQDPAFFKGKAMTYYGRWTYKYEEAAKQGASGVIIVHETAAASYPWKVVESSWSGPQFYLDTSNGNMDRLPFEAWLTYPVAEQLLAASGEQLESLKSKALSTTFQPVPLSANISVHLDNTLEKSQSFNIGGVLPGSQADDELFLYMGHWDHLGTDLSTEHGADNIYNGAVDNATGVAGVLAMADTFSQLPKAPSRSIGFLAVTAEESGLLGSAHYTAHPAFPMEKTVAGINMDALNVYGQTTDIVVVGYGSSSLEKLLKKYASTQQREMVPELYPEKGSFYRSDHFNFAKRGVPVLYAKGGVKHRNKGEQYMLDMNAEYSSNRYHAPADEINQHWDLSGLSEDLKLFFDIGYQVGSSQTWPYWYEGNEFKSIRDASLGTTSAESK